MDNLLRSEGKNHGNNIRKESFDDINTTTDTAYCKVNM